MSGTKAPAEKLKINDRDERILQMIVLGRPVRAIAQLEGLDHDYCRKICTRLAKQNGVEYKPDRVYKRSEMATVGLTDATRRMRSHLGDRLYDLGDDSREVARAVGMTIRCLKYAKQRPFKHDWSLSQIERLASALDKDVHTLLCEALNA